MSNTWFSAFYLVNWSAKVIIAVPDKPKLLDDGDEILKSQGRGWWFNSRLWNLLSTWQILARWSIASCALVLACRPFVSKKKKEKSKNDNHGLAWWLSQVLMRGKWMCLAYYAASHFSWLNTNIWVVRYVGVIWFIVRVLQLLPIRFTRWNLSRVSKSTM